MDTTTPLSAGMPRSAPLAAMQHGERGTVVCVADPKLCARLAARGLVPGATLQVLRGGDPLLIKVDESRWAISGADASRIEVALQPAAKRGVVGLLRSIFA